jgi:predicted nucleic acid-binding protein
VPGAIDGCHRDRYTDTHKLGWVDAASFVIMRKHKLRVAFSFDTHFAAAGFRLA